MGTKKNPRISINFIGVDIEVELEKSLEEKIVEVIKEEFGRVDMRNSSNRKMISELYGISIEKIG